jgi:hypothetical protein
MDMPAINDEGKNRLKYRFDEVELEKIRFESSMSVSSKDNELVYSTLNRAAKLGLLRPVLVSERDGDYFFTAGSAALLFAKAQNLSKTRCCIIEPSCPDALISLIDCQSMRNPNPIEEAAAIRDLIENHRIKQKDIAEILTKSVANISESYSINNLPADVKFDRKNCDLVSKRSLIKISRLQDETQMREKYWQERKAIKHRTRQKGVLLLCTKIVKLSDEINAFIAASSHPDKALFSKYEREKLYHSIDCIHIAMTEFEKKFYASKSKFKRFFKIG